MPHVNAADKFHSADDISLLTNLKDSSTYNTRVNTYIDTYENQSHKNVKMCI